MKPYHSVSAGPGFLRFVAGTVQHAGLVLNGEDDPAVNARIVLSQLR